MHWRAVAVVIFAAQTLAVTSSPSSDDSKGKKIPAVFAFGDSILDTGNNNVLPTIAKCNFPPYGEDFLDRQPTGRFSNGKVPSDFIASKLGVKELLPPYLTTTQDTELLTGVSFASGATGYDPLTAKPLGVLGMDDQLDLFREYKTRLASIAGQEGANSIINKGLHVICCGTNDLMTTYTIRKVQYNVSSYTDMLLASASTFIEELYKLGARKIAAVGVPPAGCVPAKRTLAGGVQRGCSISTNQAVVLYNGKLIQEIKRLQRDRPDATIVYIDIYSILSDIVERPSSYGFLEVSRGCCGTGLLELSILCNSLTSTTCGNNKEYVFWDSVHPTERTYEIIVERVKEKYLGHLFL